MASAACFMAGYWTKLSGWLTWLSIMGLHYRNPLVLHAGDVLVRCALFFANFLPLADHLSVDAGVKTWQLLQRRKCDAAFQARRGRFSLAMSLTRTDSNARRLRVSTQMQARICG